MILRDLKFKKITHVTKTLGLFTYLQNTDIKCYHIKAFCISLRISQILELYPRIVAEQVLKKIVISREMWEYL